MKCAICGGEIGFGKQEDIAKINNQFLASGKAICYSTRNHVFPICEKCGAPIFENLTKQEIERVKGLLPFVKNSANFDIDCGDMLKRAFITSQIALELGRMNEYFWSAFALCDLIDIMLDDAIKSLKAKIENEEDVLVGDKLRICISNMIKKGADIKGDIFKYFGKCKTMNIGSVMLYAEICIDFNEFKQAKELLNLVKQKDKVVEVYEEYITFLEGLCDNVA